MAISNIAQKSLSGAAANPIAEVRFELWCADSGSGTSVAYSKDGGASDSWVIDGSNSWGNGTTIYSSSKVFTLSNNAPPGQQYAFEAVLAAQNGSYFAYAALWDATAGVEVATSLVSTKNTSPTTVRSGQFTLTPGHQYAIYIYSGSTAYYCYLTEAALIAFP